ncbi:MAG: hypothetical protein NC123_00680 [Butyrivibrio sp.]|nr:hypothetical protein [Acetatifactor muris]MCM1558050.1 hypothetical protein [Butyrivibrio sp.]
MLNRKKVRYIQYYVEGSDEKCIVNALKSQLQCIIPGKVEIFNMIQNKFTTARIRPLKSGTAIVLVFDTDKGGTDILAGNIKFLKQQQAVEEVLCIPQVDNLEDKLVYSCNIKSVRDLTGSCSVKDFKRDLLNCTNVAYRLSQCGFSIQKMWSRIPVNEFCSFPNQSDKIKVNNPALG